MTVNDHLNITIGNLVIQLCTAQAKIDELLAEVERLKTDKVEKPPQE